jgi:signal transduction histidine kinase
MSRRISNPLAEMRDIAREIANGNFNTRVRISSKDEVGELARTFNHMAETLGNLEKMRSNFIANVSHELRTPMTSIAGFIEGMIDGTIPIEKQGYYLSIVKQETLRLTALVNDLLDLAKMEAGEVQLNITTIDLSELIRRSSIKFENQINRKNINFELALENENRRVMADPDAIERVLTNLLDNAIKFTSDSGCITIKTVKKDQKVYTTIEDNGIGIQKEDLPYIWERFFKTDKSRSKDMIGSGLGLAIIKNIIQKHNERIWVESEFNKGSKFTFSLETDER